MSVLVPPHSARNKNITESLQDLHCRLFCPPPPHAFTPSQYVPTLWKYFMICFWTL